MKKLTFLFSLMLLTGMVWAQPLAIATNARLWERDKDEVITYHRQMQALENALKAGELGKAKRLHGHLSQAMAREIEQSEAAVRQAQREVNQSRRELNQEQRDLNSSRRDAMRPHRDRRDDVRDLRDDRRDVRDDQRDLRDDRQDRARRQDRLERQRAIQREWASISWASEGSALALAHQKWMLADEFYGTLKADLRDDYGEMIEDVAELREDNSERREDRREARERY